MPSYSVVVLHHNKVDYSRACLQSLLFSSARPLQIINVDNGSSDGTDALLQKWQSEARALGIAQDVTSPTFVLINEYASAPPLLHLDAYRLENLAWDELRDAGLEDFLSRTDAVRVVEWPSMIAPYLPAADWKITIHIEGDGRRIEVEQG